MTRCQKLGYIFHKRNLKLGTNHSTLDICDITCGHVVVTDDYLHFAETSKSAQNQVMMYCQGNWNPLMNS